MDTLKRALSPVCYALFVGAVCLVCDLINERVYAGAINSLAFNLTAFWAVFFLLPRPMYDEDTVDCAALAAFAPALSARSGGGRSAPSNTVRSGR